MENKNQSTSFSSSSFTAQLFGDNDSQPSSSTGVFASIFPPPATVLARNPNCSQFTGATQKETSESQVWTTTHVTSAENVAKNTASANSSIMNMERRSVFQERVEPSPLSSSLYYGGQEDMYVCSSSDPTSQSYPKFKKMEGKDDPNHLHSASRGNWWQGSLYY
ncbi:hypothetical protein L6452_42775 [Arctium lappa]|uniref:Uncharacterized protein n=1 Tax=Arctium lappa TaxID=4217 RepID=A0ACB8XJ65_ARCLA|nr:hypothetical protein L6452_42775 [Arctium lappa]